MYTYHTAITDYVTYLNTSGKTRPVQHAARWFSTVTSNRADRVVAPSVKVRDVLRPVHVIPNGIELARFQQTNQVLHFRQPFFHLVRHSKGASHEYSRPNPNVFQSQDQQHA